jgi:hypothetical protein
VTAGGSLNSTIVSMRKKLKLSHKERKKSEPAELSSEKPASFNHNTEKNKKKKRFPLDTLLVPESDEDEDHSGTATNKDCVSVHTKVYALLLVYPLYAQFMHRNYIYASPQSSTALTRNSPVN